MQEVSQMLNQLRDLYSQVLGQPAPEIQPGFYAPFPPGVDPLQHAAHEVHHLQQFSQQLAQRQAPLAWVPRADCFTTDDNYLIRLEIPGVERESLKVLVTNGECVVRGERKLPTDSPGLRPVNLEREWGPFERRFVLPPGFHAEKVSARFSEGLLELKVDVADQGITKEMKVEVA